MARIAVLVHEFDAFETRKYYFMRESVYLLFGVLRALERRGHRWKICQGVADTADADLAILHVDCSVVPQDYIDFARSFPLCVNVDATDITKRKVSGALLRPGDAWDGPVIVKSDLNFQGYPEVRHNRRAESQNRPPPHPGATLYETYPVFDSLEEVPEASWESPNLVVEKFIPENDPEGYAMRTWVFMGSRERCTRHVARRAIVKADEIVSRTPAEVPEELRVERKRLGVDFGKFDFVVHDGKAILLDANKTPGSSPTLNKMLAKGAANLADGLEEIMR